MDIATTSTGNLGAGRWLSGPRHPNKHAPMPTTSAMVGSQERRVRREGGHVTHSVLNSPSGIIQKTTVLHEFFGFSDVEPVRQGNGKKASMAKTG